jgi:hypothetical protein
VAQRFSEQGPFAMSQFQSPRFLIAAMMAALALTSCGGGGGGSSSGAAEVSPVGGSASTGAAASAPVVAGAVPADLALSACEASGKGTDYQVGADKAYTSLAQVPWESLKAGDTVRIFPSTTPYVGKFILSAVGTADAPVRVCGVRSASGERPIVTGENAATRPALAGAFGPQFSDDGKTANPYTIANEARGVVFVSRMSTQAWEAYPQYVQIDGLHIRAAHPAYGFTDAFGTRQAYQDFGACIWVQRGQNVVIADNEIEDCSQGIFSNSLPDGDFSVTKNLRIAGNYFHNNGIAGVESMHTTYIQSIGAVYEFNRYGAVRSGALGNSIKDRSAGTVIRYNRIEAGAHAIDLVEAEDYFPMVKSLASYRTTYVYGNQIIKSGNTGSTIHYGGDHQGNEASFRQGVLFFFNNSVRLTGTDGVLFQLSTVLESAEVWNNVFMFDDTVVYPILRTTQDAPGYVSGGVMNLGRNWAPARWSDAGPWATVGGTLTGSANMITDGPAPPADATTFVPVAGSRLVDTALAGPSAASAFTVGYQLDSNFAPQVRSATGAGLDLGAVER